MTIRTRYLRWRTLARLRHSRRMLAWLDAQATRLDMEVSEVFDLLRTMTSQQIEAMEPDPVEPTDPTNPTDPTDPTDPVPTEGEGDWFVEAGSIVLQLALQPNNPEDPPEVVRLVYADSPSNAIGTGDNTQSEDSKLTTFQLVRADAETVMVMATFNNLSLEPETPGSWGSDTAEERLAGRTYTIKHNGVVILTEQFDTTYPTIYSTLDSNPALADGDYVEVEISAPEGA